MVDLKKYRAVGVPLIAVETSDPYATMQQVVSSLNGNPKAIVAWDYSRNVWGVNDSGKQRVASIPDVATITLPELLMKFVEWPAGTVAFIANAHLFWTDAPILQGIQNLRDVFKANGSTLILLCTSAQTLPQELRYDVVVVEDPLPTVAELNQIVVETINAAAKGAESRGKKMNKVPEIERIVDALLGLNSFAAENALAMAVEPPTVNLAVLRQRMVKTIEQTKGLSVYRGMETMDDLGGMKNAVDIFTRTIKGMGIRAIVFVDEIDKGLAASKTDSSGTTQDQIKVLLSYLQDFDILGSLLLGPPGTGKTFLLKVIANACGIPLIMLDLGAAKGSLVGQSEQAMREMIRVIQAITGGKALFVGACNRTDPLPPELRRRLNFVTMFMDLPTGDERAQFWTIYTKKYGIALAEVDEVDDTGWTAAEVKNCCLKAWGMKTTLSEAAKSIVPVSVSAAEEIQKLRQSASGRYISAAHEGLYTCQGPDKPAEGRTFNAL